MAFHFLLQGGEKDVHFLKKTRRDTPISQYTNKDEKLVFQEHGIIDVTNFDAMSPNDLLDICAVVQFLCSQMVIL